MNKNAYILNKLYVDLNAIAENYKIIQNFVGKNINCIANIKSNAYGLGMLPVMRSLSKAGCNKFFVTSIEEAIEIRNSLSITDEIYVLNGVFPGQEVDFAQYHIIPILNTKEQFEIFNSYCLKKNKNFSSVLNIDSGINRFGFNAEEAIELANSGFFNKKTKISFLMSQLAFNGQEHEKHLKFLHQLQEIFKIPISLADSNYICLGKDYHFDIIRLGIILYGCAPKEMGLKNAVSLYSNIIQIKNVTEDIFVGHNNGTKVKKGSVIATIPIGYSHGLRREIKDKISFYINNTPVPIIGDISMDLTVIDVTDVPPYDLKIGTEVEILGKNNTITHMAEQAGTTRHDILNSLNAKLHRIYIE